MNGDHVLIYSGVDEDKRAAAGVGCIIHRDLVRQIRKWEAVSERLLLVELESQKGKYFTIIVVYGPNEDEKVEVKDKFWKELSEVTEETKGNKYIVSDFNSRVGKRDEIYKRVIGIYGEEMRNNNGRRMLDFCLLHDLIVTNTFYQHRNIHKFTREQPNRGEKSIIGYILVERTNWKMIMDTRVLERC